LTARKRSKQTGGKLTVDVSGRIAKAGGAPLLLVTAEAVRNGRVVKRATATRRGIQNVKAGAFRVPVALRGVPRAARLRATASLVDENTYATARVKGGVR
jgi:hypothetical protein